MRRPALLSERATTGTLTVIPAARPPLALRPPVRPAVTLAEEFSDRCVAVRGQSMHAVARLDPFEFGGRFGVRGRVTRSVQVTSWALRAPIPRTVSRRSQAATLRSPRGSIGVEIALALALVAAAIFLVWTISHRLGQNVRRDRFVEEFRALAVALEAAHQVNGKWPSAALEGEVPAGLAAFLPEGKWPDPTALGGRFVWTPPLRGEPATLGVTDFTTDRSFVASRSDLQAIDAILDDGNLGAGRFRTGFNGWPIWRFGP